MISASFKIRNDRNVISSKLPIGVGTKQSFAIMKELFERTHVCSFAVKVVIQNNISFNS